MPSPRQWRRDGIEGTRRHYFDTERRAAFEPLYDIDPQTGATIEVFYADEVLAGSFGKHAGCYWWFCRPGCLPDCEPYGPFATS